MQTTFVLASLAGSAVASHILNAAPAFKRDLESLQARQTDAPEIPTVSEECQSAALELLGSLPTPGPKIVSDAVKNPQTGDPCSFSTPEGLSSEYESYSSELLSWYSANADDVSSAAEACSDLASLGGDLLSVCSTEIPDMVVPSATTPGGSNQTPGSNSGNGGNGGSGSGSDDGDDSETETSTGGAPRETGMAMAAVAAGLLAVAL